jgi:hypothetical protein
VDPAFGVVLLGIGYRLPIERLHDLQKILSRAAKSCLAAAEPEPDHRRYASISVDHSGGGRRPTFLWAAAEMSYRNALLHSPSS